MLLADIQMSGDRSAWEEVGGAGARLSLVVRGGAAETLLHQNSSHLAHWHAQLHVDAHAQASLHFTFTNSCGLFLGERKGVIHNVHTYRVPQCMSPRRNWDYPPLPQASVPSSETKGRGLTRLRVRGWGRPNSDDWRKSLALCLLCGVIYHNKFQRVL
jgi:hypothetical protein